jgi:hypothetical protein
MIGAPPSLARHYLHPDAFRYYLPSLLAGVLQDIGYLDWALEALLPSGQKGRTDRPEWVSFWQSFSEQQRNAVHSWLKGVRSLFGEQAGPAAQHEFDKLEAIWGRS